MAKRKGQLRIDKLQTEHLFTQHSFTCFRISGGNMPEYSILLEWQRDTKDFQYSSYNRDHIVTFGINGKVFASASPEFNGDPHYMDPEQAFIMSISSCHMLTFLAMASNKGFIIDNYSDKALGEIGKNKIGRLAIVAVFLQPMVIFSGENKPSEEDFHIMHDSAHRGCLIANSISSCVKFIIEPSMKQK